MVERAQASGMPPFARPPTEPHPFERPPVEPFPDPERDPHPGP